jgi:hypothetical protein
MFCFELISVRIEDETGIVVGTVMRPEARGTLVNATQLQRGGVELIDRLAAWCDESQVETWARWYDRLRAEDEQQSVVVGSWQAVSDGVLSGENSGVPERSHDRVVERRRLPQIADTERKMAKQFISNP